MGNSESLAQAFVAVGSNLEPERNIPKALDLAMKRLRVTGVSTFYRTEPLGRAKQPPFLNGVWEVASPCGPRELKFDILRPIEEQLGRVRGADKYAARTIDLDIAVFGRTVVNEEDLRIPDPDIRVRAFLAVALFELAGDIVLPDTGEALAGVVHALSSTRLVPDPAFTNRLKARLSG